MSDAQFTLDIPMPVNVNDTGVVLSTVQLSSSGHNLVVEADAVHINASIASSEASASTHGHGRRQTLSSSIFTCP